MIDVHSLVGFLAGQTLHFANDQPSSIGAYLALNQ